MRQIIQLLIISTISLSILSCTKSRIRGKKLEGNSFTVVDVSVFSKTDYKTWLENYDESELEDGGNEIISSSGEFDFINPANSTIEISYTERAVLYDGSEGDTIYNFNRSGEFGTLEGKQSSFWLNDNGSFYFFELHEAKGKKMTIVFQDESVVTNPNARLGFVMIEKSKD